MKKRILFVDDNPEVLEVMKIKFEDEYEVFTAESGLDAMEIKKKHQIHLVVTDLQMPVMDGIELYRELKAFDPFTLVIALTGQWETYELVACREMGFDDYLVKPVEDELIQRVVEESFNRVQRWLKIANRIDDMVAAEEK